MTRTLIAALLLAACGTKSPPPPPPPPPQPTADAASGSGSDTTPATQCKGPAPAADFVCVQDCGPPVSHPGDPAPGWSWLSPADAENRKKFGCPKCLPPDTQIATPDGDRAISELRVGAAIYTVDAAGQRTVARVVYTGSTPVTGGDTMVRVALADGRVVAGSAGHPDGRGTPLGELHEGDTLDGARITNVAVVPFSGARTFDVLPSGGTGLYIANGVVLRSTFAR